MLDQLDYQVLSDLRESKVTWAVLVMMVHLVTLDHQVLLDFVVKLENKESKVILANLVVLVLVVNLAQWGQWDFLDLWVFRVVVDHKVQEEQWVKEEHLDQWDR